VLLVDFVHLFAHPAPLRHSPLPSTTKQTFVSPMWGFFIIKHDGITILLYCTFKNVRVMHHEQQPYFTTRNQRDAHLGLFGRGGVHAGASPGHQRRSGRPDRVRDPGAQLLVPDRSGHLRRGPRLQVQRRVGVAPSDWWTEVPHEPPSILTAQHSNIE